MNLSHILKYIKKLEVTAKEFSLPPSPVSATKTTTDKEGDIITEKRFIKCKTEQQGHEQGHNRMMNTLTMNTNLQSQQNRHRNNKSREKTSSKESLKGKDPNARESNMLMTRKENHHIPLSISVDQRNTFANNLRKNPIAMAHPERHHSGDEAGGDEDAWKIKRPQPNDVLCGRGEHSSSTS